MSSEFNNKEKETMSEKTIEDSVKEEKRKYYREYRQRNKSRIAQINARYWENRAKKTAATESASSENSDKQ